MANSRSRSRRLVVVANRLPVNRVRRAGKTVWETSPGGLVSALVPTLKEQGGVWVGWTGSTSSTPAPFEHETILNVPVRITRPELDAFYSGFSNRTLWPLYHDAVRPASFHRSWWWPYVDVNRRFAEAAAAEASRGGIVWIQDYHLQLAPAMLRELRPDLRIGFFLHIPFPPQELFAQLPWRRQILEGLLGADLVGFQTRRDAQNFAQLASRMTNARRQGDKLEYAGRSVHYGAFPISIDVSRFEEIAGRDETRRRAREIREGLGPERRMFLGVDRLDYTKGIDIRIRAFQELLDRDSANVEDCVLVQTAVPSREHVSDYADLRDKVELLVGRINGSYGRLGRHPIQYMHKNLNIEELVALYVAADVMLVTPLRDGMNLVCKEFVASRLSEDGVLVLSEFTGAAHELHSALLTNPHDLDNLTEVMHVALGLSPSEQRRRMRALRRAVKGHDVYDWARSFLEVLDR